jgi:ferredoxin
MDFSHLKKIRTIVSLLFFIPTSFLFLDFSFHFAETFSKEILYLQFIPSIISFLSLAGVAAAGFIFVIILTLLFGRIYCSSICPLGTLQDIISFIKRKFTKRKAYKRNVDFVKSKYVILLIVVILFFSGNIIGISLLDPYSNFGRIISHLFKPIYIGANNIISSLLEKFNYYSLFPYEIKTISLISFSYSILFFFGIISLVYYKGRLFCNTLCPVGVMLGAISKISFIKISIDQTHCTSCNSCTRVCKAGCIDKEGKNIDFSRCVNCFNCFAVCPSGGISFNNQFSKKVSPSTFSSTRRNLLKRTLAFSAFLSGVAISQIKIIPEKASTIAVPKKNHVTPPGSKNLEYFNNNCTACHLCITACPTQVLQPAFLEYGLSGFLQPKMDYQTSFCNYDCKICSDVCPTDAIKTISLDRKKTVQIGIAKFIKDNCIVETEKTECGACSEHCPTKAVKMVPYEKITIPEVQEEYCIGCGACEYACPTKPHKSIYVEGNVQHKIAKIPPKETLENQLKEDEFPF